MNESGGGEGRERGVSSRVARRAGWRAAEEPDSRAARCSPSAEPLAVLRSARWQEAEDRPGYPGRPLTHPSHSGSLWLVWLLSVPLQ